MIQPYFETELGKLYHGDCLEILPQLPMVDLILTDPLYNIKKAVWDSKENYYYWLISVFQSCEKISKGNATLWFFHMVFSDLAEIHKLLEEETSYRHKQLITINKGLGSIAGRCSIKKLRSFPRATEYLQFYTFEDRTGAEQLSERYQRINPMAEYLRSEFKRAKITSSEITKLFPSKTGGLTGCVSNWLLGLNFPLKNQYEKMREYLNGEYLRQEYEDLRQEYEYLRQEYEDLRYYFDLPKGFTDVWDINFYTEKNMGHETPKPTSLIGFIINATLRDEGVALDPFMGSGTLAVACERLNRRWIGIEISKEYCDIAVDRIKKETAQLKLELP